MNVLILAFGILLNLGISTALRVKVIQKDAYYVGSVYNSAQEPLEYDYDSDEVERVAVDKRRRLIYAVGEHRLTVLTIRRHSTLKLLHTQTLPSGFQYESVQSCNGFVTAAVRDTDSNLQDVLYVYKGYSKMSIRNMERILAIPLGADPAHHAITRDCRRIVLAFEHKPAIAVITFRNSKFEVPDVKTLTFEAFDTEDELERLSGEWFKTSGADPIQSFDPEWVCFNDKETRAYVSMFSNNGIAQVDLTKGQETIITVNGLGLKSWADTEGLDGSDAPREARLMIAPIFSTFNAEFISCQTIKGKDYIILSGRGRSVGLPLGAVVLEDGFPDDIQDLDTFGDLIVKGISPQTDPDGDDRLNIIVTEGSRSFAMFCVTSMGLSLVADTGSDIERLTMNTPLYNSEPNEGDTLVDSLDETSASIGSKPEAILTQKICGGRYIVMLGYTEHPGWLFVYTLDTSNLEAGFVFQQKLNGYARTDSTMTDGELYKQRLVSLRGTEQFALFPGTRRGHSKGKLRLVSGSKRTVSVELLDLYYNCRARTPNERFRWK